MLVLERKTVTVVYRRAERDSCGETDSDSCGERHADSDCCGNTDRPCKLKRDRQTDSDSLQ